MYPKYISMHKLCFSPMSFTLTYHEKVQSFNVDASMVKWTPKKSSIKLKPIVFWSIASNE